MMGIVRKHSTGNGKVERLVPVSALLSAVGITLTVCLPIIGFLGGARYNEYSLSIRLSRMEREVALLGTATGSLAEWQKDHAAWASHRSEALEELRTSIKMMEQRERFRHNDTGRFGADYVPPGLDD